MNSYNKSSLATFAAILGLVLLATGCKDDSVSVENPIDMPYSVTIDPEDFINENITGNTFFPIQTGRTLVYEGEDEDGAQIRVEETFTGDTKVILGVTCIIVNAKEYEDGELIEDTFDWYAQDNQGNIWYFGEDSNEIEDGEVVSKEGSWEAGKDGALPGIIMFNNPLPGVWYRQEYWENEAEDVAQILSLDETVTVPLGTYENSLQIAEWNPLEPGIVEHKFYAPQIGLIRAVKVEGEDGFEDLVEINDQ